MLQKSANIFEDWIWCSFKRNFCSERKVKGLITKLSVLKVHCITGKCGVKVVLKSTSSICAYFIVLDTLGYDNFMHSIKSMRCFHSYSTNLNKIVSNTISFWNAIIDFTFWNFLLSPFQDCPCCSEQPQPHIQTSDEHSSEDNSKRACWATVLQAGNWVQPRVPTLFPGRNSITSGARFCSQINSEHENPPN